MDTYVADTHSLLWYISSDSALSDNAAYIFDQAEEGIAIIIVSVVTLIEAIYLTEKNKIPPNNLEELIDKLRHSINYLVEPVTLEIATAIRQVSREEVPDMPDRIITATALNKRCKLITKDRKIKSCGVIETIW